MGSNVLVTGGAGFVGSHVAAELLKHGKQVTIVDDLSGGFLDNVPPGAEFVEGSVTNHKFIDALCETKRFTCIYHLAAYAAEGLSHFIKRFNYENNVIGSVNLINAAVNYDVPTFVFTSSIAVYGSNQLPMKEDMQPSPEDSYGIAKNAVEMELRASHEMFGLRYVIFRPHNVYGEHQNIGDKYRNVVGIFMNQLMQGKPMTIFGDGRQTRAFTYVRDIAPIMARAAEVPGAQNGVFNLGSDHPISVSDLAQIVAKAMGRKPEIQYFEARKEVLHAFSDHSRVRQVFGNHEDTAIEEGVGRMAAWARRVGARSGKDFKNIEIQRNLPKSWRT